MGAHSEAFSGEMDDQPDGPCRYLFQNNIVPDILNVSCFLPSSSSHAAQ